MKKKKELLLKEYDPHINEWSKLICDLHPKRKNEELENQNIFNFSKYQILLGEEMELRLTFIIDSFKKLINFLL